MKPDVKKAAYSERDFTNPACLQQSLANTQLNGIRCLPSQGSVRFQEPQVVETTMLSSSIDEDRTYHQIRQAVDLPPHGRAILRYQNPGSLSEMLWRRANGFRNEQIRAVRSNFYFILLANDNNEVIQAGDELDEEGIDNNDDDLDDDLNDNDGLGWEFLIGGIHMFENENIRHLVKYFVPL